MALGTYDANGIWHYGESDNIALFSDTLNKLADSTSSAFTADRSRLATLEAGSLSGLIPVVPTSVTVAGGTVSVNGLGVVTFNNATNLSINGTFTSNFRNYLMVINQKPATGAVNTWLRFRSGTSDLGTAVYNFTGYSASSSMSAIYSLSQVQWQISQGYGNVASFGTVYISNPQTTTTQKTIQCRSNGHSGSGIVDFSVSGYVDSTQSFDGITLWTSSSSITGSLQIFGIND